MLPSKLGYFREWKKRCGRVTSPVPGAFFFFLNFRPPSCALPSLLMMAKEKRKGFFS